MRKVFRRGLLTGVSAAAISAVAEARVPRGGSINTFAPPPPADTIAITSIPGSGTVGGIVSCSGTYTGGEPVSIAGVWSGSGGTASISAFTHGSGAISFNVIEPAVSGTYNLTIHGTAGNTATSAPSSSIVVAGAGGADFTPGLYYPSEIWSSTLSNAYVSVGSGFVRGLNGQAAIDQTGTRYVYPNVPDHRVLVGNPGFYGQPEGDYVVNFQATDGTTTFNKSITLHKTTVCAQLQRNFIIDSASPNTFNFPPANSGLVTHLDVFPSGTAVTLTSDPSGLFTIGNDFYGTLLQVKPGVTLSDHIGEYPIQFTCGGTLQRTTIWIVHDNPPIITFVPSTTFYSSLPLYTSIGRVFAYDDQGIYAYSITSNPGNKIFLNSQGQLRLIAALVNGDNFSVGITVASDTNSNTLSAPIAAVNGTVLPPTNMTLTITGSPDNYFRDQPIGTPAVTGVTGTKVWSMVCPQDDIWLVNQGRIGTPFVINSSTGAIRSHPTDFISARTYVVEVTCTDGPNRCIQTFNIPVAWHAGPTLHVGEGMLALHGAGVGYEHLADIMPIYSYGIVGRLPTAAEAGATVIIYPNADDNYYVNDNRLNDSAQRQGWLGPLKFVGATPTGAKPRLGGPRFGGYGPGVTGVAGPGVANDKAFMCLSNGEFILDGIEISNVHTFANGTSFGGTGRSALRKDGDTSGDLTLLNCKLADSENLYESGNIAGWLKVDKCEFVNGGGIFQGAGNTHNLYVGAQPMMIFTNSITWHCGPGHALKCRARAGTITGNRFYDAETGNVSNLLEMTSGGNFTVSNNVFHKGTMADNPFAISFASDNTTGASTYPYDPLIRLVEETRCRTQSLTLTNNTFILMTPPNSRRVGGVYDPVTHVETPADAIALGHVSWQADETGKTTTYTLTGNSYYMTSSSGKFGYVYPGLVNGNTSVYPLYVTETGAVALTAPPALDFSNPSTNTPSVLPTPTTRFSVMQDPGNGNFFNFFNMQILGVKEDWRISAASSVGTVIDVLTPYGADLFGQPDTSFPQLQNPFGPTGASRTNHTGTTWELRPSDLGYFGTGSPPWAPAGRYTVTTNPDGTGTLKVNGVLPAAGTTDWIKVRATGPTRADIVPPLVVDRYFYIVMT